jgi:hypothetical protein
MRNMHEIVGQKNILMITLDTLRFDVADRELREGRTPFLEELIGPAGWERRHTPGSFTYAAHHAFFAGFLPTAASPGKQTRLFSLTFPGSTTTGEGTVVFDSANIVEGLRTRGYRTICIGGVGFFNKLTPLGSTLPGLFCESHWRPEFGVTCPESTRNQVTFAVERLRESRDDLHFVFLNISAIHQPNRFYLPDCDSDSLETHAAALRYVDAQLKPLFDELGCRGDFFAILCSDHGSAYGEEGFEGHRLAHSVVWDVPYAEFLVSGAP